MAAFGYIGRVCHRWNQEIEEADLLFVPDDDQDLVQSVATFLSSEFFW